jgi:Na+-driven multidrug efflux pump
MKLEQIIYPIIIVAIVFLFIGTYYYKQLRAFGNHSIYTHTLFLGLLISLVMFVLFILVINFNLGLYGFLSIIFIGLLLIVIVGRFIIYKNLKKK